MLCQFWMMVLLGSVTIIWILLGGTDLKLLMMQEMYLFCKITNTIELFTLGWCFAYHLYVGTGRCWICSKMLADHYWKPFWQKINIYKNPKTCTEDSILWWSYRSIDYWKNWCHNIFLFQWFTVLNATISIYCWKLLVIVI